MHPRQAGREAVTRPLWNVSMGPSAGDRKSDGVTPVGAGPETDETSPREKWKRKAPRAPTRFVVDHSRSKPSSLLTSLDQDGSISLRRKKISSSSLKIFTRSTREDTMSRLMFPYLFFPLSLSPTLDPSRDWSSGYYRGWYRRRVGEARAAFTRRRVLYVCCSANVGTDFLYVIRPFCSSGDARAASRRAAPRRRADTSPRHVCACGRMLRMQLDVCESEAMTLQRFEIRRRARAFAEIRLALSSREKLVASQKRSADSQVGPICQTCVCITGRATRFFRVLARIIHVNGI